MPLARPITEALADKYVQKRRPDALRAEFLRRTRGPMSGHPWMASIFST